MIAQVTNGDYSLPRLLQSFSLRSRHEENEDFSFRATFPLGNCVILVKSYLSSFKFQQTIGNNNGTIPIVENNSSTYDQTLNVSEVSAICLLLLFAQPLSHSLSFAIHIQLRNRFSPSSFVQLINVIKEKRNSHRNDLAKLLFARDFPYLFFNLHTHTHARRATRFEPPFTIRTAQINARIRHKRRYGLSLSHGCVQKSSP